LAAAACATDYDISAKPEPNEAGELEAAELPAPESSGISTPDEGCLGGADLADSVLIDESCGIDVVEGALNAELEWELPRFSSYGEYSQILMAPLVAQLTDDNGDGAVNALDIPDIIVVTDDEGQRQTKRGILRWLPGDGTGSGAATQRVDVVVADESYQVYPYRYSNAAVADVNNDGAPEIIIIVEAMPGPADGADSISPPGPEGGTTEEDVPVSPGLSPPPAEPPPCFAAAFAVDGSLVWISMGTALTCGGHAPAIADLEGDGEVEVIIGDVIYAGASGEVLHVGGQGKGAYKWKYEVDELGYKYHGNSVMAAMALVALKYLDEDNARRREMAARYRALLADHSDKIRVVPTAPECESSQHLIQVRVAKRDEVLAELNEAGIYPGVHYRDNTLYSLYRGGHGHTPNSLTASDEIISLPLHMSLSDEDVDRVGAALIEAVATVGA
jgi:hypothetical protein